MLKHAGVRRAVQCDIDEQVTRMSEKYFPELCESNADPRATVMFDDGIAYMANAAAESIDIIIVDSTDPVGPAEGLFNRAFYENCLKALRPDGLLVQQSESPLALMHLILDMRQAMNDAGFRSFRTLPFPQPCYPTGYWSCRTRPLVDRLSSGFGERASSTRVRAFRTCPTCSWNGITPCRSARWSPPGSEELPGPSQLTGPATTGSKDCFLVGGQCFHAVKAPRSVPRMWLQSCWRFSGFPSQTTTKDRARYPGNRFQPGPSHPARRASGSISSTWLARRDRPAFG